MVVAIWIKRITLYIRNKPQNWVFKLWVVADPTGYTVDFDIYCGACHTTSSSGKDWHMLSLLSSWSLSFFKDTCCFVIFLLEPAAVWGCLKSSIFVTGTLKVGNQGVPPEVKQLKAVLESKKVPRGTGYYYQQASSPLIYCCWKDSKTVTVASTRYQGHSRDTFQRQLADHNTNRPTQVDIAISEAIHQYNKYMGGADKFNQYPSYHLVHRQTPRYWKTLLDIYYK